MKKNLIELGIIIVLIILTSLLTEVKWYHLMVVATLVYIDKQLLDSQVIREMPRIIKKEFQAVMLPFILLAFAGIIVGIVHSASMKSVIVALLLCTLATILLLLIKAGETKLLSVVIGICLLTLLITLSIKNLWIGLIYIGSIVIRVLIKKVIKKKLGLF